MDDRDRRGQLLLVAGLGLAVAFVVLALVLNAVVFTENLATRNHGETDGVVGYERAVEDGVGGLLVAANVHNDTDHATLRAAVADDVATWDGDVALLSAASGTVTSTSLASVENGTRVAQPDERGFTNATGEGTWTLAEEVNETRRFELVATPDGGPVTLNVSDGSASWLLTVTANGTNTDVEVTNGTDVLANASVADDTVRVDVTEGRVAPGSVGNRSFATGAAGERVANWTFAEGVSAPYEVAVEDGGNADGRYGLVVPASAQVPDDGAPARSDALYRATVSVAVQNDRVTYESPVAVAPESAPAEPPWADVSD